MPTPYTTSADLGSFIGAVLRANLTNLGGSETESEVIDMAIRNGDAEIDLRLAACGYATPFADLPSTPAFVQMISRYMAVANLYLHFVPDGDHHKTYLERAINLIEATKAPGDGDAPPGADPVDSYGATFDACGGGDFACDDNGCDPSRLM